MSGRRLRGLLAAAALVTASVGGLFAGIWLGERASEPSTQTLTLERPAATTPRDASLRSPAGFDGFEDGALGGIVTRHGVATTVEDGGLAVESGASVMQVRYTETTRLYRIVADGTAARPLTAGDVVVVRLDEDGNAEAVLRVPGDLREGDSR